MNVSILIKISQNLNYHKFSIKSYVLDVESPHRGDSNTHPKHMILLRKKLKLSIFIILIPTPDFPHFYYMLGGNLGSLLYGDVSVMTKASVHCLDRIQAFILYSFCCCQSGVIIQLKPNGECCLLLDTCTHTL